MEKPTRIPLFPLDFVLLPGMPLPLHIFEDRYKLMIARCMEQRLEFGIVLASENNVAAAGCTAEILQKIREYPDGRVDILTEGRSPFRLVEMLSQEAYYEAIIEYLEDAPSSPNNPSDKPSDKPVDSQDERALIERFQECHKRLFGQAWERDAAEGSFALSYRMAGRLPLEIEKRQALLEMRAETERQTLLLRWIEELVPKLAQREHGRRVAGGNGHALN